MKRLINRQQASNAIDALNQITHIKQNLESIKNYQGVKNSDKSDMDNMIDELNIKHHFKTIERELKTLKSYAEYNLKRTGWDSKYSAHSEDYLILDKIVAESVDY